MTKSALFLLVSALALASGGLRTSTVPIPAKDQAAFDMVISGGRVMDPESGLDAVRNVGIRDGKIAEISEKPLQGKQSIDARGLVVAPGFIDLHEHGQEPRNYEFQAHDGVTTSLELEVGTEDVPGWYARREGKSLVNFGVSVGHIPIRMRVMKDPSKWLPTGAAAHKAATPEQLRSMQQAMEAGLKAGALAVGMGINYTEAATHQEIIEMFRVAAKYQAPVHAHVRFGGTGEPSTGLAAVEEVIAAAASTGAPLHVVHITSIGLKETPQLIQLIEGAQHRGLDVTTECYPYVAASTGLESALFDPGWQERMGITFKDIQWAKTGERLTAETFEKYRAEGGAVVIYAIPESAALAAVRNPMVMIGSDGMLITGAKVHPRGQGTFSRVLGHYVREEKALDLMTALRKMTLMPAQRLEKRAPAFHNKGRIRVGADADITVFDPATIIDKATFEEPLQYSAGISFVLVNGVPVLTNGKLVENVFPGRAARAPIAQ
ncbi:MAG TPA: amidohydrolase family protein [Candidatus Acidoferrum sp.]|nr:amidohydrolase family protein [Candidatus Acidoferrum sp.]